MEVKQRITVNDVMKEHPCSCYSRKSIKKLFGRKKYLTPLDVKALPIPLCDRAWVLWKWLGHFESDMILIALRTRFGTEYVEPFIKGHSVHSRAFISRALRVLAKKDKEERNP